ncbi:tripartite tricarboxylate transporter substrate binding protein [Reyranella sp. MMS21-HV4-11]|uniref:Tripartite tricarboxylate transporter substrate binding protein n=1 Tax=Reyranella humidisoli TaxID=2849149 RepID=A0ABS6IUQ0_9HYPH|nr:tripartite tricarboxylate transporter substrate binding protein [Reyranella sp. MMS21-HV4-11]MBU8876930.1 tripartite tricarboxylate transporter substrate binding protein [Reyranella sp. MMS21-HV4-11]
MKLISLLVGMLLAMPAAAQDYPARPIKIITAFGPGTATDIAARVIGQDIAVQTGQTVVIDNKSGAEGQIAAQSAAAAAPDGYTLFFTTQTTQAINPHVYKSLAYDPVKSFAPIAGITLGAQIVMVRNDLPAKTIQEFIALAKAQPGKLSFGSGNGSSRGGAELFRIMTRTDLLGVPYKTQPQAITDLLGGRIDIIFSDFTVGLPPVLDGRARGLAVTSKQRIPGLDQFPTVDESGVPGFEMWAWTAMYAPAGTPKPIVDKLNALVRQAAKSPAYLNLLKANYGVSFVGSPEELAAFQATETKKWAEIVSIAGMKEP